MSKIPFRPGAGNNSGKRPVNRGQTKMQVAVQTVYYGHYTIRPAQLKNKRSCKIGVVLPTCPC